MIAKRNEVAQSLEAEAQRLRHIETRIAQIETQLGGRRLASYGMAIMLAIWAIASQTLSRDLPSPVNPPPGCHFHPRCAHAMPTRTGMSRLERMVTTL